MPLLALVLWLPAYTGSDLIASHLPPRGDIEKTLRDAVRFVATDIVSVYPLDDDNHKWCCH